MATTTPYGFRYPLNSAPVNVAGDIQALAEDVNNKLVTDFAKLGSANTFTNTNTFGAVVATSITVGTAQTGFLKANGTIDNNTYLTEVAALSFDGDVTGGTGEDPITLTLANSGVTAGDYTKVTVDSKGRVTIGSNPTTLAGYGITDAALDTHTHSFSEIISTPTTLSGYGIIDAQPLNDELTAIASISAESGLLKKTATNTWELDTTSYLSSITLTGDATGTLTSASAAVTLANSGVTAGTYSGITFDSKGRATSASRYASFANAQIDVATTTTALDFATQGFKTISITADTTFSASNYAAGKSITVLVTCDTTARTLAFPANWKFVGTKPTSIAASKVGILTVTSFTASDTGCVAAWAVQA